MISALWKLEYDGIIRPLRDWGIDRAVVSFVNQTADGMTFSTRDENSIASARFSYGKTVTLWRDGVRWFSGPLVTSPFAGIGGKDTQNYKVAGPWWYLENIIYQQPRWLLADPVTPTAGLAVSQGPRTVLFQGADGAKITNGGQAADVVDYAIAKGAPIQRGTFSVETYVPYEKGQNLTCAEVINRCLRWTRDAVVFWDFTGATPKMEIKRRGTMTPVEFDVDAADHVVEVNLTSREDLVPRGVILDFERTLVDSAGNQYVQVQRDTAGVADEGINCPIFAIPLAGVGHLAEPVPWGLAADFYGSVSQLHWEGSIVLAEAECLGAARPGNVVNLIGSVRTEWQTMVALVQSVTEDLFNGVTTIEVGPPFQLGLQDFLDLARFTRGDGVGNGSTGRFDGTPDKKEPPPNPNKQPPGPPAPGPSDPNNGHTVAIKVCQDGQEITLWVQAVPSGV